MVGYTYLNKHRLM